MASRTFLKTTETIVFLFVLLVASSAVEANIIYVDYDAPGSNNGSSWTDACNYLQDALAIAASGDEIRVAEGTYKPDLGSGITPGDRTATFQLINGVNLKGGYAGLGQPDPNARNIQLYETILSGDLAGVYCYRVVTGSGTYATAVMDGFTITESAGGSSNDCAGLHNLYGSPTINNCTFIDNSATSGYSGSGMYNRYSSPTVTNCIFKGSGYNIAMLNELSDLTITNCIFIRNSWCAIESYGGSLSLTNCLFDDNERAMFIDYCNPVIKNCTFSRNDRVIEYDGGAKASLTNCIVWSNGDSGSFYVETINYSCVQGSWNKGTGNISEDPLFLEPEDGDFRLGSNSPCINTGDPNYVPEPGETDLDGNPRLISGRIDMGAYEFTTEVTMYDLTVTVVSGHGTVEPDSGSYLPGTVVTLAATPEAGYYMRQWTGTDDDASCELTNTVTMDSDKTVTVEFGLRGSILVPGQYPTIQEAIDAAACGDTIIVSPGVHYGDINFNGKNIKLLSMNPDDPMCVASTIIQGSGAGPVVTFSGGENQSCVLDGLTITNNYAGNAHGIYCSGSNPTIINCTISRNTGDGVHCCEASSPYVFNCIISENMGAGVICSWWESDPNITNCTITGNGGEGVWCWKSRPKITNCILSGNAGGSFTIIAAYPEVSYSCIDSDGISSGIGNINDDPLFCGWSDMAEVYVDNSNPGPGDGTQGNPFSDLASALVYNLALSNQSPCLGSGEGGVNMGADTGICDDAGQPARLIHVASGTYDVRGLSLAHNVSVRGAGRQDTVIEGTMFGLRTGTVLSYLTVTAGAIGGVRVATDQTPEILYCTIRDNDSGVYCAQGASPTITDCTIKGNSGCGLFCAQGASPGLTNCIINNNGNRGVSCEYNCSPTLTNCEIAGNSGDYGGGLWFGTNNHPILTNCAIVGNYANYGAGVCMDETSNPILINCTIAGNSAFEGGGLRLDWDCVPVLTNSIIWGNSDNSGTGQSAQIQRTERGTTVINYSCLQGWTGSLGGIGNFGDDPLFVDVATGDYHLMAGSPCIDAGDPNYVPGPGETDLDGNPRIRGDAVDMGAYEFQGILTLYVDADAPVGGDGGSWAAAYNYLQDAMADARSSAKPVEIRVAKGIYTPDSNSAEPSGTGDRNAAFKLINGVIIKGGYAGFAAPNPDARDIELYETVLSGDLKGDDVGGMSDPSWDENSRHVLIGSDTDANTVLDGFTIKHGNADSGSQQYGGGMYNSKGDLALINCKFIENFASQSGGGLHNYICSPTLINCEFISNTATQQGGGVHSGLLTMTNCKFTNNSAEYGGGISATGMTLNGCEFTENSADYGGAVSVLDRSTLTLNRCKFSGNHANYDGGAMWNWDAETGIAITNCLFVANSTYGCGGAIYNFSSNPVLKHCTFTKNSSGSSGSGHAIASESSDYGSVLTGCILWDGGYEIYDSTAYGTIITYSDVQGGWPGEGNIDADPCFVDPDGADNVFGTEDDNLRLSFGSPCIDTGDPNFMAEHNETDLDGNPRVIGGRVDMGAYEFCGPIYIDDDALDDPGPGDPQVSDPLENGTQAHPFDTIQEGINVAKDGYTVLVRKGSYFEPASGGSIDFLGKNITVRSEDPADWDIVNNTIIRCYVQFSGTEGPSCKFVGFKISNLEGAIYGNHTQATISHCNISGNGPCGATVIQDCDGTISNCLITDNTTFFYCGVYPVVFECNGLIKNCTIANNESGLSVGSATIENCIIYNNAGPQVAVTNGNTVNISYSNVQDGLEGVVGDGHVNWGPGNIDTDPCFVRLGYWITDEMTLNEGDYHLRSEGWRWNTEDGSWTYGYITSRCIDAGNPGSPLLGELMSVPRDPDNVWGINLRINMGAFGGTSQASMPPYDWALLADLNNDGTVNFIDFAYQAQDWLTTAPEQPGDLNRDGVLNKMDLRALAEEWLKTTIWIE